MTGQYMSGTVMGNFWTTPITYLSEKTFLPFFKISDNNQLLLKGLHDFYLDCNDS